MTSIQKTVSVLATIAICLTLGLAWLHAQDATSSSGSSDKWSQIQDNNKQMLKSMETIESNLNFIKARSMSGGRNS